MANECDGDWDSEITYFVRKGHSVPRKELDGTITVDPHATPAFIGRHFKDSETTPLDRTDCRPGAFGNPHIRFSRSIPDSAEVIFYEGHVIQDNFIFGYVEHRGGPADGDTGTWGATREEGPFQGEGRGKRKP